MGTTSSLSDRFRIMRKAQFPDILLSPQVIVYCVPGGCDGGDPTEAFSWIHQNGIPNDSCQNYVAKGDGNECTAEHICENCHPDGSCNAVSNYTKYEIVEHGTVSGESAMMAEIFARGPIACGVEATQALEDFHGPGVFHGQPGQNNINHEISVYGWGMDPVGGPYWVIRNSWGTYFGDQGWFKLSRKQGHDIGVTQSCDWAVPKDPGF
jgi:cathepsin X